MQINCDLSQKKKQKKIRSYNQTIVRLEGGVNGFFFNGILIFFEFGAHAKFQNPRTTPSGRKVTGAERKRKKEKTPLIVNT